ncbi:VOC family protein [Nocardioides cheoyonin]|uniref:VOC family protein n=1 Tax=Nocardioides cheoyonin TaxID=3156615 RepID=UPI0032B59D3A
MRTTILLPTHDRRTAHAFCRDGLGLETPGEPAEDGVPEPLRVVLSEGCQAVLVPDGGFSWVAGRPAAPDADVECVLTLELDEVAAVDALFAKAVAGGGAAVAEPGPTSWGYRALVADPDGHRWQLLAGTFADVESDDPASS